MDFHSRNYDLFLAKETYKIDNLENILSGAMSEADVLESVKDRIIVIGDFSLYDTHQSIYGDTAGSLILLNTYLALKNGDNKVSIYFVIFLYVSFFWASLEACKTRTASANTALRNKISNFISAIDYVFILVAASVISFFIFEIGLSILYLSFYLFALQNLLNFLRKRYFQQSA